MYYVETNNKHKKVLKTKTIEFEIIFRIYIIISYIHLN